MAVTIPEVELPNIRHCLLIDLSVGNPGSNVNQEFYISNAWKAITYNGNSYSELGGLLNVGDFREDIKTTNGDLSISLSGIPTNILGVPDLIDYVGSRTKGGEVTVYRAFFDEDYAVSNVYERFSGTITNFAVSEDEDLFEDQLTVTIDITCAR